MMASSQSATQKATTGSRCGSELGHVLYCLTTCDTTPTRQRRDEAIHVLPGRCNPAYSENGGHAEKERRYANEAHSENGYRAIRMSDLALVK